MQESEVNTSDDDDDDDDDDLQMLNVCSQTAVKLS